MNPRAELEESIDRLGDIVIRMACDKSIPLWLAKRVYRSQKALELICLNWRDD